MMIKLEIKVNQMVNSLNIYLIEYRVKKSNDNKYVSGYRVKLILLLQKKTNRLFYPTTLSIKIRCLKTIKVH